MNIDFDISRRRRSFDESGGRPLRHHSWGLVIGAVVTAGSAIAANDSARKGRHAVEDARDVLNAVEYEPIDIDKLVSRVHEQAVSNATQSLALEQQLQPNVSETRKNLSKSINEQLALGGQLPPDVVNQVTSAARVAGGNSGTLGAGATPLTAQMLGISALGLLNQRQNAASGLLATNPLPVTGLDPGTIASLEAQNSAAQNQFNLAKAGGQTNLINSGVQASAAQNGVYTSLLSSLAGLLTKNNSGTIDSGSILGKIINSNQGSNNPATNPVTAGGGYSDMGFG